MAIHSSVSTLNNKTQSCREEQEQQQQEKQQQDPDGRINDLPEFLFGVQVGVEEKVNSQLKTLFGHRLVVGVLQLCLPHTRSSLPTILSYRNDNKNPIYLTLIEGKKCIFISVK